MEKPPAHRETLPSELWEEIILWLPPGEIPPMRLVNRDFSELIDSSPAIKYRLELFSAGLEERAAEVKSAIRDRLQKLDAYCSRWERFNHAKRTLLGQPPLSNIRRVYIDQGFLICIGDPGGGTEDVHFTRLPSPAMEISHEEWTIRGLPASSTRGHKWAIHPPSNLLATPVLSEAESSFRIEMFRMSDGKRYFDAVRPFVMEKKYWPQTRIVRVHLQLTGHRLAALVLTAPRDLSPGPGTGDLFVWDWMTGRKYLEHLHAQTLIPDFIDEYRLIGTVFRDQKIILILWDSSSDCNLQDPPGLIFEPGPDYVGIPITNFGNCEVHHVLPFYESPSMGIIALAVRRRQSCSEVATIRTLIVPVKTLASFASRMGTVECIPWQDWQHLATPIELRPIPLHTRILHSQVLCVYGAQDPAQTASILRVYDFSLRSRRRKAKGESLPPYTTQEFQLDIAHHKSLFGFTESGVVVTSNTPDGGKERHFWTT
ncbi:hypothetical protein BJ322DRAFT_1104254 [Thelephora terrestris]|uniref:F-box domain-containing protein n=1 Tax=Thelephora terrestris TaxID=56493 RepID=A0A9P6LBD3_9AGAM|nr:hypothetical protein BJ322DRAFT_1104254 [Thelephora terrestris]